LGHPCATNPLIGPPRQFFSHKWTVSFSNANA
jgi:hypothetical protein